MKSTGIIDFTSLGGKRGSLIEDDTETPFKFINPAIKGVRRGQHFEFMKITQRSPGRDDVVNILTTKIPN